MILALGQFIFSTDNLTFNELQRSRAWTFGNNETAQGRNQYQFTGVVEDITIPFVIYQVHGLGTRQSIDDLAEMADTGAGYLLIDGSGYIYGVFVITGIDDTRSILTIDGVPQKIDGSIKLMRVDDNRIQADKASNKEQKNA